MCCKPQKYGWTYLALLLLFIFISGLFQEGNAQTRQIEALRKRIDHFLNKQEEVDHENKTILSKLQKQSEEITRLKKKKSQSPFSEQKLAILLRKSRQLSTQLTEIQREKQAIDDSLSVLSVRLVDAIDQLLLALFRETVGISKNSREYKNKLTQMINFYQLRERYRIYIGETERQTKLIEVRLEPDDPPEERKRKISILKDQKDYLNSLLLILKEKIEKAEEWHRLASLGNNLLKDLQLQEIGGEQAISGSENVKSRSVSPFDATAVELGPASKGSMQVYSKDALGNPMVFVPVQLNNYLKLKPEELGDFIAELKQITKLLQAKSDSLDKIIHAIETNQIHR